MSIILSEVPEELQFTVERLPLDQLSSDEARAVVIAVGILARHGRGEGFPLANIYHGNESISTMGANRLASMILAGCGLGQDHQAKKAIAEILLTRTTSRNALFATLGVDDPATMQAAF